MSILINQMSANQEIRELLEFLDSHKTVGSEMTHTVMSGGKFYIPDSEMGQLYLLYSRALATGELKLDLVERHKEAGPLYIDLDYKQPIEMLERQFGEEHVTSILATLNEIIIDYFDVEADDLLSVVTWRPAPVPNYKKDKVSDGLHIYYPRLVTEPRARYMVRDAMLERLSPLLDQLTLINRVQDGPKVYDQVIDKAVVFANGALMLGCTKLSQDLGEKTRVDLAPYEIMGIYDSDLVRVDRCPLDGTGSEAEFLSLQRHIIEDCQKLTELGEERIVEYKNDRPRATAPAVQFEMEEKRAGAVEYDEEDVRALVSLLAPARWDGYESWVKIGWALHNTDPNSRSLFALFQEYSARSPAYEPGCCEMVWRGAREGGNLVTLGSLHAWAKEDDMAGYYAWKQSKIRPYLEDACVKATHYSVAEVLHRMYRDDYKCASDEKKGIWYVFKNHRWNLTASGAALRLKLPKEISLEYLKLAEEYSVRGAEGDDLSPEERDECFQKATAVTKLLNQLESRPFVDNVMKWAVDLFLEEDFIERLNEVNKDLFCFKNGVYDLAAGVFREGHPSDYISLSAGCDYVPYDPSDPRVAEVNALFESIFPDPDVIDYMFRVLASCLDGHVLEQKFRVWMGGGSNGKGILRKLCDLGFADYCKTLKATVLTRKQGDAESANSSVAKTKGARIVFFDEPDQGDKIHTGTMKHYSGGDPIQARALYSLPFDFYPQFAMILLTNIFPEVPPDDHGTWRRMEPVPFENQFVEDEPTEPNQFKMDKNLPLRLPELAPVFMSMLVEKYKVYKAEGIKIPRRVREFKREYQRNCDIMLEFLDNYVVLVESKDCKLNIPDLHCEFTQWFKTNNYPNRKFLQEKAFRNYLEEHFKELTIGNDIIGAKFNHSSLGVAGRRYLNNYQQVATVQ